MSARPHPLPLGVLAAEAPDASILAEHLASEVRVLDESEGVKRVQFTDRHVTVGAILEINAVLAASGKHFALRWVYDAHRVPLGIALVEDAASRETFDPYAIPPFAGPTGGVAEALAQPPSLPSLHPKRREP